MDQHIQFFSYIKFVLAAKPDGFIPIAINPILRKWHKIGVCRDTFRPWGPYIVVLVLKNQPPNLFTGSAFSNPAVHCILINFIQCPRPI